MYSFRKSKKGFTLIELMVVVAIIAVLALLGLRLYSTQQIKAKEALVRANAGTIQVAIQTELVDNPTLDLDTDPTGAIYLPDIQVVQNPFQGLQGVTNAFDTQTIVIGKSDTLREGFVGIDLSNGVFVMECYGDDGRDLEYTVSAQP